MAADSRVRRFARAALKVAHSVGQLDSFLDRFGLLDRAFRENRAFRHLLITRRIPVEKKLEVLGKAFAGVLTGLELEVLRFLLEQRLDTRLPDVARTLIQMARAEGAQLDLTVFTPQPLPEPELRRLGDRVAADLGRPLRTAGVVDPALLGGVKLRLGNTLVDGTLARRLELLRERLV